MDILTENEHQQLNAAKQEFTANAAMTLKTVPFKESEEVKSGKQSIVNAIDAFNSENFVVTCVGMLKAGKSTLVNLFARNKDASPTGFGFDTTLRPALITYTPETTGKIEIWLPSSPEQTISKTILQDVFLCLRRVKKAEEVQGATCCEYPLTADNLHNALCEKAMAADGNMLPCEPVMVVVKVPHDKASLLSEEITLLDTPGLDSGLSAWTDPASERYSWIIENSDLLLFLQSSVAPLNQNATRVLRDIHNKNTHTPIWLVQNEMIAKPWLPEERIHEENAGQRAYAAKMFNEVSKIFKQVNANLGKADSAVFDNSLEEKDRKRLWEESEYLSMEQRIRQDLNSCIGPIRRQKCIEDVKGETQKYVHHPRQHHG